jgi:hypothetical protein
LRVFKLRQGSTVNLIGNFDLNCKDLLLPTLVVNFLIGKIKVLLLCHFVIESSTDPLLPPLQQETREKKIIVKFLPVLLANDKVINTIGRFKSETKEMLN